MLDRRLADEYAAAIQALWKANVSASRSGDWQPRADAETPAGWRDTLYGASRRPEPVGGVTGVQWWQTFGVETWLRGQGAPLVPAFHRARLIDAGVPSGGSTLAGLPMYAGVGRGGVRLGTGPGNTLLDG